MIFIYISLSQHVCQRQHCQELNDKSQYVNHLNLQFYLCTYSELKKDNILLRRCCSLHDNCGKWSTCALNVDFFLSVCLKN